MEKKIYIATKIIQWYKKGGRSFPWRRTKNAFHILVSEIMLQKTDSKKVLLVYPSFIKKYATPQQLAKANLHVLKREVHLLGINDRARRLKATANAILRFHAGKVPSNREQLLNLLGVGIYTANAVLCFAFNENVPLLDTNVIRVIRRVFSIESEKRRERNDQKLWQFAESLVPHGKAIDYNRGILDFAAIICTARNPNCLICPIKGKCDYFLGASSSATNAAKIPGS